MKFVEHSLAADIIACLRFYSRLNLSMFGTEAQWRFPGALRALPLAGGLIGACGACVLLLVRAIGVPAGPAAVCAVAALVGVTGAMHEDGLADVADGFGGGRTRGRKLEIMRDSRLGAYGAAALALALVARVAAVAALCDLGLGMAACAVIAAGAVSRVLGLAPLLMLRPARDDGAGAAVVSPDAPTIRFALSCCAIVVAPLLMFGPSLLAIVVAVGVAMLAAIFVARLAEKQIGGYTGDVLGAAQQAAEIAFLILLTAR